ncbi:MAG: LamG domain-containing protein [Bacteroidales bacterium]
MKAGLLTASRMFRREEIQYLHLVGLKHFPDNYPGTSLQFDGIEDYVSIAHNDIGNPSVDGDFTIEAWVKLMAYPGSTADIVSKHKSNGTPKQGYAIEYNTSNGLTGTLGTSAGWQNITGQTWGLEEWHHVAITYNASSDEFCLYDSGVLQGFIIVTNPDFTTNDLYFGSSQHYTGNLFNGVLDEVKIWDIALDSIQIREQMYVASPPQTNLAAYWQFNEAEGDELFDLSQASNGSLHNMDNADWIVSSIPFGPGYAASHTEASGQVDFSNTGLSMNFDTQTSAEITVARIDTLPNTIPSSPETIFSGQYWIVNRYGSGSFETDLTFTVEENLRTSDENHPANISLYTRGSTSDTAWALLTSASSVNAENNTVTFEGISGFSQFILARELDLGIELNLSVFLEGPFNGTDMITDLNSIIPLQQTLTVVGYYGNEEVDAIPNADVVDWIGLELRDAPDINSATESTAIGGGAFFLLKDGSIVGLDGSSLPTFDGEVSQQLFVVIWHRNHLPVISAYPLIETGGIYTYDFTTGITQAYGDSDGYKQWENGVAVMVAGDGDADGYILSSDKTSVWTFQAAKNGYFSGDFNMDTQVNNVDKNNIWIPNNDYGYSSQVPD